jgi:hypothetical protein
MFRAGYAPAKGYTQGAHHEIEHVAQMEGLRQMALDHRKETVGEDRYATRTEGLDQGRRSAYGVGDMLQHILGNHRIIVSIEPVEPAHG